MFKDPSSPVRSLRAVDALVSVVPDSLSDVEYAQHAAGSSSTDDPDLVTWNVEWTAPEAGGAVLFHAAANSGNGDNSPLGDLVYTTEATSSGPVHAPAPSRSPVR